MLRRDCATAQSRQSILFSHTQCLKVDEDSIQNLDMYLHFVAAHARLKLDANAKWMIFSCAPRQVMSEQIEIGTTDLL